MTTAAKTVNYAGKPIQSFDPRHVLTSKGLEPQKVSFAIARHSDGNRLGAPGITVLYAGQRALWASFSCPRDSDDGILTTIDTVPSFKGKSLGSLTCIILGIHLALFEKRHLRSEQPCLWATILSPDICDCFDRLSDRGFFEWNSGGFWIFRSDLLRAGTLDFLFPFIEAHVITTIDGGQPQMGLAPWQQQRAI